MRTRRMGKISKYTHLPADGDTVRIVKGGTQIFSWAPVPQATRYRIQMTETGTNNSAD